MNTIYLLLFLLLINVIDAYRGRYYASCVQVSQKCYNHRECCSGYCHRGLCSKKPKKKPKPGYTSTRPTSPRPTGVHTSRKPGGGGNGGGGGDVLGEIANTGQCILNCVQGVGKTQRKMYYNAGQQTNSGLLIQTVYNVGSCVVNIANKARYRKK